MVSSTNLFEFAESSLRASLLVELTKSADLRLAHAYSNQILINDVLDVVDRSYFEAVTQRVIVGLQLGSDQELSEVHRHVRPVSLSVNHHIISYTISHMHIQSVYSVIDLQYSNTAIHT